MRSEVNRNAMDRVGIAVIGLSYPFRGGISHYSTLLVRVLREKYRVPFITFKRQYPKILFPGTTQYDYSEKKLLEENDSIIDSINPFSWVKTALRLKSENVGLVVMQWWHPFFGLSLGTIANICSLVTDVKICFLCHNVTPHESTFVDKLLSKYAFRKVSYFIVHSEKDKNELLDLKPSANVTRTCHPTYSVFGDFHAYEKYDARRRLDIVEHRNVLLFFGLVRAYKGLKVLIHALQRVVEQMDCILLIVGEFYESKAEYTSLIAELNLTDYVVIIDRYVKNEEIPLYFTCADVVVLPYLEATQSGIVQIAFGLTKPVITTDVGGLPEAVEDGRTGFIVERASSEKLSDTIKKYFRGKYEEKFSKEIERRARTFSWEHELEVIESFLAETEGNGDSD